MDISIESSRLRIRPILENEISNIHALLSLAETDRYNALGIPEDVEETRAHVVQWVESMNELPISSFTLTVELASDKTFVGLMGLKVSIPKYRRAEIWYKLDPNLWGLGFATEAANAMIRYCFEELDIHRVEAGVAVENQASIRVLEKIGMTREGRTRKSLPLESGFSDTFLYAVLREDLE